MRPHRFFTALIGCAFAFLCDVSVISPLFSEAEAQDVKAVKRVKVRDANNKNVGIVLSFNAGTITSVCANPPTVALEVKATEVGIDETYSLLVCKDGFSATDELNYETTDCTGQAYFGIGVPYANSLVPRAAVDNQSGLQTLYVEETTAPAETIDLLSTLLTDRVTCATGYAPGTTLDARRAVPLFDLVTKYTPPFSLD